MYVKDHPLSIKPHLRVAMSFDFFHEENGKVIEHYPQLFFVRSFHRDVYEEHTVLSSEKDSYDYTKWSPWINLDEFYVPKKKMSIKDDAYGLLLPNELPDI